MHQLPTLVVTAPMLGKGWREVPVGSPVRTHYQWLCPYPELKWRLTSFANRDGLIHDGRVSYRSPASIKAWIIVSTQWLAKVLSRAWRRVFPQPPQP